MTNQRFDIHQHITDKIVSAIERGAGDFRLPWHRSAGSIMRPTNVASKKAYRGINVVALWAYGVMVESSRNPTLAASGNPSGKLAVRKLNFGQDCRPNFELTP